MKKFLWLLIFLGLFTVTSNIVLADEGVIQETDSVTVTQAVIPEDTTAVAPVEKAKIDGADTAFIILCSALVMFMTPGLALFYGGMVRRKNVLGTMMQSFVSLGVITIIWIFYGYSLAFGKDVGSFIGNLDFAFLKGVGLEPNGTIPHQLFMVFQMMFAILTPALITGAFAERFKFKSYLIFLVAWLTLVYCPVAHWVWGGGWISKLGGLDFAGGLVVHIASGTAALVTILVIGKRKGYQKEVMPPHSLPLTLLGTAILWFGWFGFNAGSALAANSLAVSAFVATQIGAGAAVLGWMFIEWIMKGKPTLLGALSGGVAGLVAITPASGFVSPISAVFIGLAGGLVCYFASVKIKEMLGYDDSLDVVGIHGVGGLVGALLTGIFASTLVNGAGANGSLSLVGIQAVSSIAVIVYVSIVTYVILKIINAICGLRVDELEEQQGLDLSQHDESGYRF
ncbi:ammonium transporter [Elusimicrobiota bacterium]